MRSPFWLGVKDVSPLLLGILPFGLITGASAVDVGLSPGTALAMSILVYAGAAQLAALQLIGSGAPLVLILATTLFINLRLLMYGASFRLYVQNQSSGKRALIAYLLVDQAYAFSVLRFNQDSDPIVGPRDRLHYYLGVSVPLWTLWTSATLLGALLGATVPDAWSLEFAIPLTFMALLTPLLKGRPSLVAAATGGGVALLASGLPLGSGLILAALCGVAAGVLSERAGL